MKTSKDAQAAFNKLNGNQALPAQPGFIRATRLYPRNQALSAQQGTDIHRDIENYVREDVEFTKAVYAAFDKLKIKQRLSK